MKILILGDGLLGNELLNQTGWNIISRKLDNTKIFDFKNIETYKQLLVKYDVIVNCIGSTNTYTEDRENHWNVNYVGVSQLVDYCNETNKKLIHISTDYVYSGSKPNASEKDVPVHCANWYGYTKLVSDAYVQLKSKNYLLIRTSFKPYPFPYKFAFINQIGNFDTVNVIAKKIIKLIRKNSNGLFNVGTNLKTMCDLNPYADRINKVVHETMPNDISMDLGKIEKEMLN